MRTLIDLLVVPPTINKKIIINKSAFISKLLISDNIMVFFLEILQYLNRNRGEMMVM